MPGESATTLEPTRSRRRDAVQALVEHSWARPDRLRPVARPHIILMVAVVTAALALVAGLVLQLIKPIALPKPTAAAPPPPASAASFTAVSGWDCATSDDHGFDVAGRTTAWYTVARGGWTQDGCHGTFEAIPMTATGPLGDSNRSIVWWFVPGAGVVQCDVMVFRPNPQRRQDSAAIGAQFYILSGRQGARFAGFSLDETREPGSWADVGTFPTSPAGIAVELVGQSASATATARLAVAQVKVRCTG
jgi:hypothetical protein